MKFSLITLFPQFLEAYLKESIIKKAQAQGLVEIEILDLRKFTKLAHNQVDDYQFGGGAGMVLMVEPLVEAIESVKTPASWVILTTPQGQTWTQTRAKKMQKQHEHLIIVCGHYEGFDERILKYVDEEISVGDYILTGGEIASLILLDSITRMVPLVLNKDSITTESFENNLLDYPVYTKPVTFRNQEVPAVLLSGHHQKIQEFREFQQLKKTWKKRPDLLKKAKLTETQKKWLAKMKKGEH